MTGDKRTLPKLNWDYAKRYAAEKLLEQVLKYLEGDPDTNIPRLLKVMETLAYLPVHKDMVRNIRYNYENNTALRTYFNRMFTETDRGMRHRLMCNFVVNSLLLSFQHRKQVEEKEGIHVPYTILIDPTSACNLKCTGCWAGEYSKHDELEPELLDRILQEAKELGIYAIVMSGGEPFVYPYLTDIAAKHNDMSFMIYTNGTKIDDNMADRLHALGNIAPAFSIEGWEDATDARRGKGVFKKIISAMDRLHERGVVFGASVTITRHNVETVTSDEFIDFLIDKGVRFMWTFHYIPIGRQPDVDLMILPEQRAYLAERIPYLRTHKPLPIADFWNDGELTGGCIAGGSAYFHITARGDVEPCAFVHFAVDNIRDKSLKEVLRNPLFTEYQKRQPFSENMLRPCPIIDNPEALREIVRNTGAHPTHAGADTILEGEIGSFLDRRAADWKKVADQIWAQNHENKELVAN
ncbi:MAG TPA: radical SAM protein [Syntrophomonadaceae bacterium]|nr:radical SAM protein [Syntrophomonadaceae bacterium]